MSSVPSWKSVVGLLLGVGAVLTAAAGPLHSLVGPEAQLMKEVNRIRREHHLRPLAAQPTLATVAGSHARDMAAHGYLSHVNPSGLDPLERVQAAGISGFSLLAENLGTSSESGDRVQRVIREWMASPLHRENILNPAFNSTGIAVVEAPDGKTIAVQLYATF